MKSNIASCSAYILLASLLAHGRVDAGEQSRWVLVPTLEIFVAFGKGFAETFGKEVGQVAGQKLKELLQSCQLPEGETSVCQTNDGLLMIEWAGYQAGRRSYRITKTNIQAQGNQNFIPLPRTYEECLNELQYIFTEAARIFAKSGIYLPPGQIPPEPRTYEECRQEVRTRRIALPILEEYYGKNPTPNWQSQQPPNWQSQQPNIGVQSYQACLHELRQTVEAVVRMSLAPRGGNIDDLVSQRIGYPPPDLQTCQMALQGERDVLRAYQQRYR